jgi:hypothetical protein
LSSVDIFSLLVVKISDVVCDDVDISRDDETDDSDDIIDDVDISLDVRSLCEVDVFSNKRTPLPLGETRFKVRVFDDGIPTLASTINVTIYVTSDEFTTS